MQWLACLTHAPRRPSSLHCLLSGLRGSAAMADHKLAHLPFELLARIAENLERKDRCAAAPKLCPAACRRRRRRRRHCCRRRHRSSLSARPTARRFQLARPRSARAHTRCPPPTQHATLAVACRVRLAASSRALRAASVRWFRGDVVELGAATGPIPPQIITWLCRVQGAERCAGLAAAAQASASCWGPAGKGAV